MKPIHYGALLVLGAVWGASYLFIGVAVPEFGPLRLMFLRVLIAGLLLLVVAQLTLRQTGLRETLRLRENWRKYLIVGLLNSALPFTLIAFSELRLSVSLAAILNSTTTLFTALVAAAWGSERLTGRKIMGVLLGVIGVGVLVGGAPLTLDRGILMAVLASLLAALAYGMGTVYAAKHISSLPAAYASTAQLLAAAVWLVVPAAVAPAIRPSPLAVGALAALILVSTTFASALLLSAAKRRPDPHGQRHLPRAGVRLHVGRPLPARAVQPEHAAGAGDHPAQRRVGDGRAPGPRRLGRAAGGCLRNR